MAGLVGKDFGKRKAGRLGRKKRLMNESMYINHVINFLYFML